MSVFSSAVVPTGGAFGSLLGASTLGPRADASVDEYALFAQAFQAIKTGEMEPLDSAKGAAGAWIRACEHKLEDYRANLSNEQRKWWELERNTWQLLSMLYRERLAPPQPASTDPPDPYMPPLNVVNSFVLRSRPHTELATIRDWLHACPSSFHPAEIRRGYFPYTKAALKHALQSHGSAKTEYDRSGFVQQLDPDAPLRSRSAGGGTLQPADVEYHKAALRTLFEYVRAGEMEAACDFARQTDHSWRAASLSGGALFADPAIGQPLDEDDVEMDGIGAKYGRMDRRGALRRRLWKKMCRRLAADRSLDAYEQALYGAVSGDVDSVLPVCRTWEDHVWCYVNALFEQEVDRILWSSIDGYYWAHGDLPPEDDSDEAEDVFVLARPRSKARQPDDGLLLTSTLYAPGQSIQTSLRKAFEKVLRDERVEVAESAREPFHIAQMCLATDRLNDLFSGVIQTLSGDLTDVDLTHRTHLIRFFAHLVLILRQLDQPIDQDQGNSVLQAYVQVLEHLKKDDLVALYAAELNTSSAVETYARYLLSLGPDADRAARKAALLRTLDHGLDLAKVACTAVDMTLRDVYRALPPPASELDLANTDTRINEQQRTLIRSLEWLLVDRVTYIDALVQANSLVRFFLTQGHIGAAREAFASLPADLISTIGEVSPASKAPIDDQIVEHESYGAFFDCLELHTRLFLVLSQAPQDKAPAQERRNFRDAVEMTSSQLHERTVGLLENDWLKEDAPFEGHNSQKRQTELSRIRQIYIPELVLRLHLGLVESGTWLPSNLQRAVDLAALIADGRYDLYTEFVTPGGRNRMPEYLDHLRTASLKILEHSRTNPLRIPKS